MSDELLSAMLDGECTAAEARQALDAIARSPALKAKWSRLQLAREALAGTRVRTAAPDFALGVMAAIEADEAAGVTETPKVVPLRRPAPAVVAAPSRVRRRWQPAVGLAAAASITAAVVVVGGNLLSSPVGTSAVVARNAATAAGTTLATAATDVAESASAAIAETRWAAIDGAAARQLNDYLMEHSNSRYEAGMGGSLSYARLAVRSADYRSAAEPR